MAGEHQVDGGPQIGSRDRLAIAGPAGIELAVPDQVPDRFDTPFDGAACQVLGKVIDTRIVPLRAAAQLLGMAPVLIFNVGAGPMAAMNAEISALRTSTSYCRIRLMGRALKRGRRPQASGNAAVGTAKARATPLKAARSS